MFVLFQIVKQCYLYVLFSGGNSIVIEFVNICFQLVDMLLVKFFYDLKGREFGLS